MYKNPLEPETQVKPVAKFNWSGSGVAAFCGAT